MRIKEDPKEDDQRLGKSPNAKAMTLQSSSVIVLQLHAEGNSLLTNTMTTDGLERSCQLKTMRLEMSFIVTADSFTTLGALFCFYNKMV